MTEREQAHGQGTATEEKQEDDRAPGRVSRSSLMRKLDRAVASGLISRKERDANGVVDGAGDAVAAASASSGCSLPANLQRKFESSLGADLSGVRVHTGESSAAANDAVGAKAYTVGNDIHFGAGQYDPSSSAGEHLLAHEVAHTVQQSGGAACKAMQFKLAVSSPGDSHEHEADAAADAMVAGNSFALSSASTAVHRKFASGTKNVNDKDASQTVDDNEAAYEKDWIARGGPKLLKIVRDEISKWEGYRKTPETGKRMPGGGLMRVVLGSSGFTDAAMREYASRQLGSQGLATLEEMVAMNHAFFGLTQLFNIKAREVKHQYNIDFESTSTGAKATVRYSNNLPSKWSWTSPPIELTGLNFSFELNLDPDQIKDKLKDPKRWKELVKLGAPWPPKVEVDVGGTLSTNSLSYWGWNDFEGAVQIESGPKGGVSSILGGAKFATGMSVNFLGGPGGSLRCEKFEAKAGTTGPAKGLKGFLKAGIGIAKAHVKEDSPADVHTKSISAAAPIVDAQQEWKVHVEHFENGSAALPPHADTAFRLLLPEIQRFVDREFNDPRRAEAFRDRGIDPKTAFRPNVELDGWASMRWKGATSAEEQAKKNLALALQRAQAVAAALVGRWPWTAPTVVVNAKGEGFQDPSTNEAAPADKARAKVAHLKNEIGKLEVQLKVATTTTEKADIQKKIDDLTAELDDFKGLANPGTVPGKESSEEWIRQVAIVVRWHGKVVDLGAASEPAK